MDSTLKVLDYDPSMDDPRVAPEVETVVQAENIAYIEYLDWTVENGVNIFTRVEKSKHGSAKNPVIGVWLVEAKDSAGIAAKAYPHNFLLATKNNYVGTYMTEYVHAQNLAFVTINRVVVAVASLSAYPFSFDDSNVKYRGIGDGWINLSTIDGVTPVSNGLQTITIKNKRDLPLPSSEYRIYVEPMTQEYNDRARAFVEGVNEFVNFVGVVPRVTPDDVWPDFENADDRIINDSTSGLGYHYAAYMYEYKGNSHRAMIGDKLPSGARPYLDCVKWATEKFLLPNGAAVFNRCAIPLGTGGNKLSDFLGLFYQKEMWHLHSEEADPYDHDTDGTPMYNVGDIWVNKCVDIQVNTDLSHNVEWYSEIVDSFGRKIKMFITDRDRASSTLLTYRYYLYGKNGPYFDWPVKPAAA